MRYDNLLELVRSSSSTRKYFLSLPVETQMALSERGEFIRTAEELRRMAGMVERYEYQCRLGE